MRPPDVGEMRAEETMAALVDGGIIAILRASSARHFGHITEVLVDAGIRSIEITLTAPDALESIAELTHHFAGDAIIGAGTVTTAGEAQACLDAGARFLVSPTFSPPVLEVARAAGRASLPGALTPTEMLAATRAGAEAVKLFPASSVRPRFITDLHGPFPDLKIIPTGGISITDIGEWLGAGAAAVGLGSPLIGSAGESGVDQELGARARRAVHAVAQARESR